MQTINLSSKQSYGSINNRLGESACLFPVDHIVKVGDGGTNYMWSDRRPYSVCSVELNWNKKGYEIIGVQEDDAKRVDQNGMSEDQVYEFTPNPDAPISYLKSMIIETGQGYRKMYQPVHWNSKTNRWNVGGTAVTLGKRYKYHDYSF